MISVDQVVKNILKMVPYYEQEDPEKRGGISIGSEGSESQRIIEAMQLSPASVFESAEDILGCYFPMSSPGKIEIYHERIGCFFWKLVMPFFNSHTFMEEEDLKRMATLTVWKTYSHEKFHYFSDIARRLFNKSFDHTTEEALAVARSYHYLQDRRHQWNSKAGILAGVLYREFVPSLFRYKSPGYRDWGKYQTEDQFNQGLVDYLGPSCTHFLGTSGVDVASILLSIEKSVENREHVKVIEDSLP
ncbi:hypothetical protein WDW89_26465 [Deltaproteobacteria bacterium TL4]